MPVEFVGGLRVSDAETVEVAKMVLVGKVNKDIVLRLEPPRAAGGRAVRRRRAAVPRQPPGRPGRRGHRLRRAGSSASTSTCSTTSPQDYIPVIASVGADREGNSLQRQRRRGGRRGRARAGRLQGDLPHRRRGLAARPRRPRLASSREAGADEVEAALDDDRRRHAARSSQACLDAIHGGVTFAHIVDGRVAALAAARAVHRRRHRHEDPARRMSLADLKRSSATIRSRPTRASRSSSSAARARACGTTRATSTSTS